jgi:threonine/homoserine/homoserine lactone efflux protein
MSTLPAFLAVAVVVIVTPGQDTALTIKNALAGGRPGGVATAAGVSVGQAIWALAASVGLAAVLVASESVFLALRLFGAAYLVYLGAHALYSAIAGRSEPRIARGARGLGTSTAFRQGVLSNLGNPKMAVFFTSLLPQFASVDGGASFMPMLALGLLFSVMTFVWLAGYTLAVDRASRILRGSPVRRLLDAVTGLVLVALGLRVATTPR